MNSGWDIGDAKKKSFKSAIINFAPFIASKMTLFMSSLVSNMEAAGAPVDGLLIGQLEGNRVIRSCL